MEHVIVERTFDNPVGATDLNALRERSASCFKLHRVKFLNSFLSADGKRMICVYRAPDAESVRIANRKAGVPFDRVWAASLYEPAAPTAD